MTALSAGAGARLVLVIAASYIALLALGCRDGGGPTVTATSTTSLATATETATATPEPELSSEENDWLALASRVAPGFIEQAFEAIALDRNDADSLLAAAEAEGGDIESVVPADAPGRFAGVHAALLAARDDLVAFRDDGKIREETGTEYDALLAAYEQAIVEWALILGVDLPSQAAAS